jgi:hypothetical protein
MTPNFKYIGLPIIAVALLFAAIASGQTITSTRIESASWTCRDASGAVLTTHERQDKAQEECTNRALKSPNTTFEMRPSGFRIVAVVVTPPATSGSATISWDRPASNTDGTTPACVTGYRLYASRDAATIGAATPVTLPAVATSYVASSLSAGTWYFGLVAECSNGNASALSALASKTI